MQDFITVSEVAKALKVSEPWIYKLVRQKRIPFFRVQKLVRFSLIEIEEWLEATRNQEWHRDKG